MSNHQILPGSIEVDGTMLTAGVHTGPSEFAIENLRYIRADISNGEPGESVATFMGRIYDATTGCLVKGDFNV